MSVRVIFRLLGAILFALLGIYIAHEFEIGQSINQSPEIARIGFALIGFTLGLIITPTITIGPIKSFRRGLNQLSVEQLLMALLGGIIGLIIAGLVAYPFSLLSHPLGTVLPAITSVVVGYLLAAVFLMRSREILNTIGERFGSRSGRISGLSSRKLILDTSVLIDGRIVEVAETGFVGGVLIIPRFVLSELHRVADSSDPLRRNRGRRGLNIVNDLQRAESMPVRIVEDDFEDIVEVDNKLVALALRLSASIVTNDYNLNQVAEAQGVQVLNINKLANAVRSIYIPGETFDIKIIQEGKDADQGVGYLDDGTMVVVEHGRGRIDQTVTVTVTKLINRETGRMIFAVPEEEAHKYVGI